MTEYMCENRYIWSIKQIHNIYESVCVKHVSSIISDSSCMTEYMSENWYVWSITENTQHVEIMLRAICVVDKNFHVMVK